MKWHNKLLQNLRWLALAVAGVTTATLGANAAVGHETGSGERNAIDDEPILLPNTLNATAADRYAAHRSHSSHRSHRSSSGGGSRSVPSTPAPRPQYIPPPPAPAPSTTPSVIPQTEQRLPKPTPKDLSMMVVRVQAALMRRGYYNGDIDGRLGPKMRAALYAFQKAQGIAQTGRMDIETLTRLGISIP